MQVQQIKEDLVKLLNGGFAPVVILLREFHFDKTGVVLDGLHFSAFSLLGHMHQRQQILLEFIKEPYKDIDLWPQPYWPQQFQPDNEEEWKGLINDFEEDLNEVINEIKKPGKDIVKLHKNGKSIHWVAIALMQHNGYHIGQIKAIGRQLGVW